MECYCTDMGIMVSVGFVFGIILTFVCGIIKLNEFKTSLFCI